MHVKNFFLSFLILTIEFTYNNNVQAAKFIRNEQTLSCLDRSSIPFSKSCTRVDLTPCPTDRFSRFPESLEWNLIPINSSLTNTELIIKSDKFCLSTLSNSNNIEACSCDNGTNQKWTLNSDGVLSSVDSRKCLGFVGDKVALGPCQAWKVYHVASNAVNLYISKEFTGKPNKLLANNYTSQTLPAEIFLSEFSLEIPPGFEFIVNKKNNKVEKFESDIAQMPPIDSLDSIIIRLKAGIIMYEEPAYFGASKFMKAGPLELLPTMKIGSALVSEGFRGVFWPNSNFTGNNIGLFESIANFTGAPVDSKQLSIASLDISATACKNECGSSGTCSFEGICTCKPGFTGDRCEQCLSGFFGPTCQECNAKCNKFCDDGLAGTGECKCKLGYTGENCDQCAPGFFGNKCEECKCGNGTCDEQGTCSCNAGFSLDISKKCVDCERGFYKSGNECKLCSPSCETCEAETGKCQCLPTFKSTDDLTCVSNLNCLPTEFFDTATQTCVPCDPSCETCFGSGAGECLECKSLTVYIEGTCIPISQFTDGKCSPSAAFIVDNAKQSCEPCPSSCFDCSIPGFNASSTIEDLQCTRCMPGFFLESGECVEFCPENKFADKTDLICKVLNSTCTKCHPDCTECSGPEINQCTKCPPNRPIIKDGQCVEVCPMGTYADESGCNKCNEDCSSCVGPSPDQCLGCNDQSKVLLGGSCSGSCPSGSELIKSERLCQNLVTEEILPPEKTKEEQKQEYFFNKTKGIEWWHILLIVLGSILFLIIGVLLLRCVAVKRRQKKTKEFGEQFDDNVVSKNLKKMLRNAREVPSQPEMSHDPKSALKPHEIEDPLNQKAAERHQKTMSITTDDYNKWKNSKSAKDWERIIKNANTEGYRYNSGNSSYRNSKRSTRSTNSISTKRSYALPPDDNWL
ncbi:15334_t:CDS:2 [Funneliformis geosporum]|nr:15334_t:CDS:2 [Funneliformis geosporum]